MIEQEQNEEGGWGRRGKWEVNLFGVGIVCPFFTPFFLDFVPIRPLGLEFRVQHLRTVGRTSQVSVPGCTDNTQYQ
jgi:hypothetical protein